MFFRQPMSCGGPGKCRTCGTETRQAHRLKDCVWELKDMVALNRYEREGQKEEIRQIFLRLRALEEKEMEVPKP